jgi:hypothetical protein
MFTEATATEQMILDACKSLSVRYYIACQLRQVLECK